MRCLHCGKRLSLMRKLARSEFCSDAHRRQYRDEQETLGLARLIESNAKPNRESTKKKKSRKRSEAEADEPSVLAAFFAEPPKPVSVVHPYTRALDAILGPPVLTVPPVDLKLVACWLAHAPAESPQIAEPSRPSPAEVTGEELGSLLDVELPVAAAQPVFEQHTEEPAAAGLVPLPVEARAMVDGFRRSERRPHLPSFSLRLPSRVVVLPAGCAVALHHVGPGEFGAADGAPSAAPVVEQFSIRPGIPEALRTGGPQSNLPEGALEHSIGEAPPPGRWERQVDFESLLRPIPVADAVYPLRPRRMPAGPAEPEFPVLVAGLDTPELLSTDQMARMEFPVADLAVIAALAPPAPPRFRGEASLPAAMRLALWHEPREPHAVMVPVGCAETPVELATAEPTAQRCAAFLLPPPDLRLPGPSVVATAGTTAMPLLVRVTPGAPHSTAPSPEPYQCGLPEMPSGRHILRPAAIPGSEQTPQTVDGPSLSGGSRQAPPPSTAPAGSVPEIPAGVAEHLAPELTAEALPCESVEVELTPVAESAPKHALPPMAQPVSMAEPADRNKNSVGPESGTEPVASLPDAPVIPATSREASATGLQPFAEPAASEELRGATTTEVDGEEEMPAVVEPLVDGLASPGLPNLSVATTTRGLAEDLLTGISAGSEPTHTEEPPQDEDAAPKIAADPLSSAAAAGESLPGGATSASGIDRDALDAAERARTGLVKLGLGRVVPLDSATEHRTALTPRTMAPKPMPPPSGLQTIPEHRPVG
ncbi:MAG: hypothetical protein GY953_48075, partial [bacterium]|nr:hypothetical protein [bacterium]